MKTANISHRLVSYMCTCTSACSCNTFLGSDNRLINMVTEFYVYHEQVRKLYFFLVRVTRTLTIALFNIWTLSGDSTVLEPLGFGTCRYHFHLSFAVTTPIKFSRFYPPKLPPNCVMHLLYMQDSVGIEDSSGSG